MTSAARILRHYLGAVVVLVLILSPWGIAQAQSSSPVTQVNRGVVELLTSGDPGSIAMAQDLASVVDDGATRRVLPVVGHGAIEGLTDLKVLHGIDMAIAQTDVLDYAKRHNTPAAIQTVTYIARLYNEELHILAQSNVARIEDLANTKVEFAGGARITGPALLGLLKINVEPLFDDHAVALNKLMSGKVAAMAYVAAKPAPLFAGLDGAKGLHFLSVPITPAVAQVYVPAQLTNADYPHLITAAKPVDTVAVGSVLLVANLAPGTERYRNVVNFVDAFFTLFPRLNDGTHNPRWQEVNLAADLPGWTRFPPADAWLKRNVVAKATPVDMTDLRKIFAEFLDQRSSMTGGKPLSQQQKDQLFDQFVQWRQSGQTR